MRVEEVGCGTVEERPLTDMGEISLLAVQKLFGEVSPSDSQHVVEFPATYCIFPQRRVLSWKMS